MMFAYIEQKLCLRVCLGEALYRLRIALVWRTTPVENRNEILYVDKFQYLCVFMLQQYDM